MPQDQPGNVENAHHACDVVEDALESRDIEKEEPFVEAVQYYTRQLVGRVNLEGSKMQRILKLRMELAKVMSELYRDYQCEITVNCPETFSFESHGFNVA